jgi:hypothetical protein
MRLRTTDQTTCRYTLLVHADGTNECEGEHACGADELAHEWRLSCQELGCGCALARVA